MKVKAINLKHNDKILFFGEPVQVKQIEIEKTSVKITAFAEPAHEFDEAIRFIEVPYLHEFQVD